MNIGIPKERRPFEYRVGLSPAGVEMLTKQGHTCYIEHDAGLGAGFSDREYELAGGSTYEDAETAARGWLADLGIDATTLVLKDGSGLSHDNRVTARMTAELLLAMWERSAGDSWRSTLARV